VYHQYTIRAQRRDELKAHLEKDSIRAGIYYLRFIIENPTLTTIAKEKTLDKEAATIMYYHFPVHPALSEDDLGRIVHSVKGF
jgi:dTDP-4-amino-4,6-dideoxygalactose transaminase